MTALEEIKKALEGVTPVAWAWKGPKGGFIADDKKPSWDCEPLYSASTLESLQRENEALKKDRDFWKEQFQVETRYRIELADRGTLLALTDANSRAEAAEAEVKRLRDLLRFSHDTLWEINPSNYDHDDVCKLNDASVEVILAIAPELGETHGKSKEWWEERTALASTGGEHHAE